MNDFKVLTEIFNKYDPMDILFIEDGCCLNENEYDLEIPDVINFINNNLNFDESTLKKEILKIFTKMFYEEINSSAYDLAFSKITKDIMTYLSTK